MPCALHVRLFCGRSANQLSPPPTLAPLPILQPFLTRNMYPSNPQVTALLSRVQSTPRKTPPSRYRPLPATKTITVLIVTPPVQILRNSLLFFCIFFRRTGQHKSYYDTSPCPLVLPPISLHQEHDPPTLHGDRAAIAEQSTSIAVSHLQSTDQCKPSKQCIPPSIQIPRNSLLFIVFFILRRTG